MKIAILTSGILPVPAVQGGAVENLIDFYLDYNDKNKLYDITVYSVWHPDVERHSALKSDSNHYKFVKVNGLFSKIKKKWYQIKHGVEYYHYTIEYFLHEASKDICKNNFDIIIMENRPAYALKIKNITKAKLVYHLHNEKLDKNTVKAKAIYDASDCIITVSEYIKKCVLTINPLDKKTRTVYNGINLSAFCQDAEADRTALGLHEEDFVLVFCGRINRDKGIRELICAMNQLKRYSNIKLMVIGGTFFGNSISVDTFITGLKELAAHLKESIIFTGYIPYSKIPNYLGTADVAVIPSVWDDPFPTTVLEAQAMGLPIITTRRGGIPEEVTEENAILLDTDEHFVGNLANAILYLYCHPEKRKQMSLASLERSKLFEKYAYAKNFFAAIEKL